LIRRLLHLGRRPVTRRIVAGVMLLGTAIGASLLRAGWPPAWFDLALNCASACAAFLFLHYRWRARERDEITPAKVKDIFS
jgi:hypothetical protein